MSKIKVNISDGQTIKYFKNKKKNNKNEKKNNTSEKKNNNSEKKKSIIDITLPNDYKIYIFKGNKDPKKDFIVTYSDKNHPKPITPSHVHWVVDLLLKMQIKEKKTKELINELITVREKCLPIENNEKETLISLTEKCISMIDVSYYEELNNIGMYDITFLAVLLPLLIVQEKTNYGEKAKKLKTILNELSKDNEDLDLFSIIRTANFKG